MRLGRVRCVRIIGLGRGCFCTVLERHDGYMCVCVCVCMYARCYVVFAEAPGYLLQMLMGGRTESELGWACGEMQRGHGDNGYIKASGSL